MMSIFWICGIEPTVASQRFDLHHISLGACYHHYANDWVLMPMTLGNNTGIA
ncbi:hypothetical protein [Yersinia kristensenii]|uniref:hypothetical protein n=1 Tax=Yersinia kristensenii TaxID=28152 RepID=UPI001643BFC5|nr:hypothetical protein [Yersinia kristensenii]